MRISLIVTTYNWKEALALVLHSAAAQSRLPDEVIVADDGSRDDTRSLIRELARAYPVPLRHVWQEDRGFRVARCRNRAIAAARGDYVISIDGDLVLHRHFVADHLSLASPKRFLQGGRLRASPRETARLLAGGRPRFDWGMDGDFTHRWDFKRRHALRCPWLAWCMGGRGRVMGCNMSFWRADLLRVNGFDERMEGYGDEDLELAARLLNAGLRQRQLKFAALALHLDHPTRASAFDPSTPNKQILTATEELGLTHCERGISDHLVETQDPQAAPDLRPRGPVLRQPSPSITLCQTSSRWGMPIMSGTLDHFTTWDDPRLWNQITELVTRPQLRLVSIHQLETRLKAAGAPLGGELDVTDALNESGIPTSNARVLASFNRESNSLNVVIRNGGVNWSGTLTLRIEKN